MITFRFSGRGSSVVPRPDGNIADGFLIVARDLIPGGRARPRQAVLRRSISSSYFAVFHALAKLTADALVGSSPGSRPNKAWVDVYRGIGHGGTKDACKAARNVDFPEQLKAFSDSLVRLQDARHLADYDPEVRFSKEDALANLAEAKDALAALLAVRTIDRKAFAAWVLVTSPGAVKGRKDRKSRGGRG